MPSIVWVPTMLSVSVRDSISASSLSDALWLFETSRACGRQHTCTTDNGKGSYRFCWSLKWRWMWAQYPRPSFITRITLWFQRAAFVMRESFKMSRPELLRTFKCLVDQPFHMRQGVHMRCTQCKNYEDEIFIAQLIVMGSGIKTVTVKIYMWGGDKSWEMTWELQYV